MSKEDCLEFLEAKTLAIKSCLPKPNLCDLIVEEERIGEDSVVDLEFAAIASLSQSTGVSFDQVLRAEAIMNCWREAGKLIATMPTRN